MPDCYPSGAKHLENISDLLVDIHLEVRKHYPVIDELDLDRVKAAANRILKEADLIEQRRNAFDGGG